MSKTTHFVSSTIDAITATLNVATDAQKTDAVSLYGTTAIAIEVTGGLNSANISFEGSIDKGVTFKPVYQGSDFYSIALSGSDSVHTLDANTFVAFDHIKVVLDVSESSNQTFIIKPYVV